MAARGPSKGRKGARRQAQAPESADDFLAAGVEFEEAGEKWRAGDAAKAMRQFQRALDNYDVALSRFPDSFDLAYNKARLEFGVTQQPRLLAECPLDRETLLKRSLQSHERALELDPRNVDALFNAAQVRTSVAALFDPDGPGRSQALSLYESALTLFSQCLEAQEALFADQKHPPGSETLDTEVDGEHAGGVALDDGVAADSTGEQWATVIRPTTSSDLLETVEELFQVLGSLCDFSTDAASLLELSRRVDVLADEKVPLYLSESPGSDAADGAAAAYYTCKAAVYEAAFGLDDNVADYDANLTALFREVKSGAAQKPMAVLYAYADALVNFAVSVSGAPNTALMRWNRLASALSALEHATKQPRGEVLAEVHLLRGDAELLRFNLAQSSELPANLTTETVRGTLLKNSSTYYEGAARTAGVSRAEGAAALCKKAAVRAAVVESWGSQSGDALSALAASHGHSLAEVQAAVREMMDDLLIPADTGTHLMATARA